MLHTLPGRTAPERSSPWRRWLAWLLSAARDDAGADPLALGTAVDLGDLERRLRRLEQGPTPRFAPLPRGPGR